MHPYSSVNLKREDLKAILYDSIELPWGYSWPHSANCSSIPFPIRWGGADTPTSSRELTLPPRKK